MNKDLVNNDMKKINVPNNLDEIINKSIKRAKEDKCSKKIDIRKRFVAASIAAVLILTPMIVSEDVRAQIKGVMRYLPGLGVSEIADNTDIYILKDEISVVKDGSKYIIKNAMFEKGLLKLALFVEGKNEEINSVKLGNGFFKTKLDFKSHLNMKNNNEDCIIGYEVVGRLMSNPNTDLELNVDGAKLKLQFKKMDEKTFNLRAQKIKYNNLDYYVRSYIKDDKLRISFYNNDYKDKDFTMFISSIPYDLSNSYCEGLMKANDNYKFDKSKDIYIIDETNNIIEPKKDLYAVGNELMFNIKNNSSNTFKLVIPKEYSSKWFEDENEIEVMNFKVQKDGEIKVNKTFQFDNYKGLITKVEKTKNDIKFFYKILNREDENRQFNSVNFKINKDIEDQESWDIVKDDDLGYVKFTGVKDLKEGDEIALSIFNLSEYIKKPKVIEIAR